MTELTGATFWPFVKGQSYVVCQFWAPWGKAYDVPLLERLSDCLSEYGSSIVSGRLSVDEAPEFATELSLLNLPAIGYFKGGSGKVEIGFKDRSPQSSTDDDLSAQRPTPMAKSKCGAVAQPAHRAPAGDRRRTPDGLDPCGRPHRRQRLHGCIPQDGQQTDRGN
jgi:hypothetical protein